MNQSTRQFTGGLAFAGALFSLALAGCRDNGELGSPASQLVVVSGSNQVAAVGTPVSTAPTVRVQDASGVAVPGVTVVFSVTAGGGVVFGDSTRTDGNGQATVGEWVLGTAPGANTLHVAVAATSVAVNVTATAVPGADIDVRASGQQGFLALVGHVVSPAPAVLVLDSYGNPVPGATVTFTVTAGGGTLTGATAVSNAAGVAQAGSWTLGAATGLNTVQARISSGAAIVFTAQALTASPTITATTATQQSGYLNFQVTSIPRVLVQDALGNALPGVAVTFAASSGDATITGPIASTDSNGIASPGDWRLGTATASLTASVPLNTTPVTFTATGAPALFLIDVRFITTMTADERDAFVAAARRWMSIITAHLTPVQINLPAGSCSTLQPQMNELVTDVVIFAEVTPIDGPNNILGSASPCASRSGSGLTIVGTMQFDSADLPGLVVTNQLVPTITHEMAHVLGFGTAWPSTMTTGLGGTDPRFIGPEAVSIWPQFQAALGFAGNTPPLENQGGAGTAGAHWREDNTPSQPTVPLFGVELMTGYIEAPGVFMPISRMTVASLKDLGYSVDYSKADLFVGHLDAAGTRSVPPRLLNERVGRSKFVVTPLGVMERTQ